MTRSRGSPIRCRALGNSAFIADHVSVFEHIFADSTTVCVWNRPPDGILERCLLKRLVSGADWETRAVVDGHAPGWDDLLEGFENDVGRVRMETELSYLVDLFATLTDARQVGVRLTATRRATCPRFHADQLGLRLLCTWIGAGTEWVFAEDVIRSSRGAVVSSPTGPVRPGAPVHQLSRFAVGVFKGDAWPGNQGRGAVHRSPQPQGWRIFVSLDSI